MEFLELAKKRYSVRKFKNDKVPKELIDKIIEAGMIAPTARNNQPQKIYVVTSEEGLRIVNEASRCVYGAPLVFIFGYDLERESYNPELDDHMGSVDADIVQTHMMLEAEELGLGTCWVKLFNPTVLSEGFDIPKNIKLTNIMPCGYAADDAVPGPGHTKSRSVDDVVSFL